MTDTESVARLADLPSESCGEMCKSVMPCICLRAVGHDGEHIGMFGKSVEVVVVHWGSLDVMTDEIGRVMGIEP